MGKVPLYAHQASSGLFVPQTSAKNSSNFGLVIDHELFDHVTRHVSWQHWFRPSPALTFSERHNG